MLKMEQLYESLKDLKLVDPAQILDKNIDQTVIKFKYITKKEDN